MNKLLLLKSFIVSTFLVFFSFSQSKAQTDSLVLYTPYTKVSVSPGNSVSYSIDVINNGSKIRNEDISASNIPRSWDHSITAGGYNIDKLATLPGEKKTLTLKVDVPYQIKKGNYTFYAKAGSVSLPLTINVSSAGSSVTEFTCDQRNMEGTSSSSFTFNTTLKNKTATNQQYALMADAPRGWSVIIKPNYKQATSTEVEANGTKSISYEVKPSPSVKAGTYKIPVKAVSGSTSADLEFEVVITGTYEMDLSTPSGLLSAHITAGSEKKIELTVKNGGTTDLENVELKASKPKDWSVTFEPAKISKIGPGQTETVYATITAAKKAIPGDYVVQMDAKTPEVNSSASFRVSVRTPITVGLVGIVIVVLVLLGIVILFKKYGRR
ncbi:NEW3 domain-containing protein [Maribellus sp. YY47]|uniref:COG1470 family protein n=1 Tax=Maribellus sp. YY47 TaxID=2929486 RepID=UPI002000F202|nr:NEW3 domain-containing protein [Maribellus sp. YY47]MCK3685213.1 NEW3 domain-containing protein [Maribellus sp. YY47]